MAEETRNDFEETVSSATHQNVVTDFWYFLRENKKWWLLPIIVVLFVCGALMMLGGSAAAPFIYTLFFAFELGSRHSDPPRARRGTRRPKRRHLAFIGLAAILGVFITLGCLLAVDLYLHSKYERSAGWNVWGYHGPVAGEKPAGVERLVVLGGSTALGYGVGWDASFPRLLEQKLQEQRPGRFDVVNLAMNGHGAYSFLYTLMDYEHLDYDTVLLYEGYNDTTQVGAPPNTLVARRESPVFRVTGYLPLLPVIMREKAMAIRTGGDVAAAYRGEKTVFQPNLVQRGTASALMAAADVSRSLSRQLTRAATDLPPANEPAGECGRWNHYCRSVSRAVDYALGRGKRVMVVTQPYFADVHIDQQRALREMLQRRFGGNPNVSYVDLGHAVDVKDPALCYDGAHLTRRGNEIIAAALTQPVIDMSRATTQP